MDKGETIANRLGQLYAFMIQRIDLAMASKSDELINEVIGLLTTIKSAWEGLKGQTMSAPQKGAEKTEKEMNKTKAPALGAATGKPRLTFSA
jgi:flagellin-specific chaperone FliS